MVKRIMAMIVIFIFAVIGWSILGGVTASRTYSQDNKLRKNVGNLWGSEQRNQAPEITYQVKWIRKTTRTENKKVIVESEEVTDTYPVNIDSSDISADFDLDYRQKGLLWYSTYKVKIKETYGVINPYFKARDINFSYTFPASDGIYDDFFVIIDGVKQASIKPEGGKIEVKRSFEPGVRHVIEISYVTQGLDKWWYQFGTGVTNVKDFSLVMTTNFDKIDFPERGISPTSKKKTASGWELSWKYKNLVSGIQIGLEMPRKLNPGPFASEVSFFAPVSLFFFFFLLFIITAMKNVKIHPMNYFFLAAAFFSFHLLLAYLADVVDIYIAFIIASFVSIFLVISYMRIVVGSKFAFFEVGLSQFVYLVVFSSAFFLEGYTGLTITILAVITLFVVMQLTAKLDWEKQFQGISEEKEDRIKQTKKGLRE